MTTNKTEKSDEILELQHAALAVLDRNREVATYEEFRALFAAHLRDTYKYVEFDVKQALLDLDRDEVELPKRLPFIKPPYVHEAR
jgi:hypothetical protein